MIQTVMPGARRGEIEIPASKSQAHRFLICSALGKGSVTIKCRGLSKDILATAGCMNALGADIKIEGNTISVDPIAKGNNELCRLSCGESGSTLRFILPIIGAIGARAEIKMEGRLPERPLFPYDDELRAHGMAIEKNGDTLLCSGRLNPGEYTLPGNVSSQYISGLLMAFPLLNGRSRLNITGKIESEDYIKMTEEALYSAGIKIQKSGGVYTVDGNQAYAMPRNLQVEGDYSNAAFFLCAGALSNGGITVRGLSDESSQGDKRISDILARFGAKIEKGDGFIKVSRGELKGQIIDGSMIPDLIPVLSVVAAVSKGKTRIINAERLRLKESDRLKSTAQMLRAIGADICETEDGLEIFGKAGLSGGEIDPFNDHRIAMAAAVAAGACKNAVTVFDAQCVQKSYPDFWDDISKLEVER